MSNAPPKSGRAYSVLVVNPGSTSTKVAVYRNTLCAHQASLGHSVRTLRRYAAVTDQATMRLRTVRRALSGFGQTIETLDAVAARGGLIAPCRSGTYRVNEAMLADLQAERYGSHASNLGAIIGAQIAEQAGVPAFIVDPVVVDELAPEARYSGLPELERRSIWHALNQKAAARQVARSLGIPYHRANLIVVHLGGGTSVAAHRRGRAIEVNNALDGDGPFAVERSGGLPAADLVRLAHTLPKHELLRKITGSGGVVAYLGTNDMVEVEQRVWAGDREARGVLDAMAWQVAKEVGACAAVLKGQVDAVVLSGGLARCRPLVNRIRRAVKFLGPVRVVPGEKEMEALALGALRVLRGEERVRTYRGKRP